MLTPVIEPVPRSPARSVGVGRRACTPHHPVHPHNTQHTKASEMNTSTLTAGSTQPGQASALSAQARRLHQRLALRTGLALLAWSRRQDERRTPEAMQLRRETAQLATLARDDMQRRLTLATPLV